jgi:hypothetical protein
MMRSLTAASVFIVAKIQGLACILREIEDSLVAFGDSHLEVTDLDRGLKETGVWSDDLERNPGVSCRRCDKELSCCQRLLHGFSRCTYHVEITRNSSIQESEAVLAWLDVLERPRLTIHMDHITPKWRVFSLGREQSSVRLVLFGTEHERDILLAVAGRKPELVLLGISDEVNTSLAKVGVLRCPVESMVLIVEILG